MSYTSSPILDFRTLLKALAAIFGTNPRESDAQADLQRSKGALSDGFPKASESAKEVQEQEEGEGVQLWLQIHVQNNGTGLRYLEYLSEKSLTKENPYFITGEIVEALRWARIVVEKVLLMKLLEKSDLEGAWRICLIINEEINQLFSSPGFRRFQTKELLFKQEVSQAAAFYLAVIQELENQIKQRDLMIGRLMKELKKCREQKNRLGTLNLPII